MPLLIIISNKVDPLKYIPVDINDNLDDDQREIYKNSWFLFRNGDRFKTNWDLLIMILAIWNWFIIPFEVSFEPEFTRTVYFKISNNIIDFLFFGDIIVNFRTSFINSRTGEEVFSTSKIAINYI